MLRTVAATLTTLLVGSLLATTPVTSSGAAAASYVPNPTFAGSATGWQAGPGDRVDRHRYRSGLTAGHVRARSSKAGRQVLSVTSTPGAQTVPTLGSTVALAVRVRTSTAPRTVRVSLEEVGDGSVVQRSTGEVAVRSTKWAVGAAVMTTRSAGSRVRVHVEVGSMARTQYLRLRDVRVTVTPPASAEACEEIDDSDPAQGDLTFAEEFDGDRLDPTRWRVRDDTFLNHDAAFIDRDNVSVHDGYLDIEGRREPESRWRSNPRSTYGEENRVRAWSTGYVDSIKKKTYESPDAADDRRFSQRFGHFEARMWVPSEATMSRGVWPAFWLRGDRTNGEIDVMESYGGPSIRSFNPAASYEWNSWEDTSQTASKAHFLGRPAVSEPIWKGWHTYGVNWSPTCLRYTLDGRTVGIARPIASEVPYLEGASFDTPFHLRFNLQVGSRYWGWPTTQDTREQFSFKVDWVRVHQGR